MRRFLLVGVLSAAVLILGAMAAVADGNHAERSGEELLAEAHGDSEMRAEEGPAPVEEVEETKDGDPELADAGFASEGPLVIGLGLIVTGGAALLLSCCKTGASRN